MRWSFITFALSLSCYRGLSRGCEKCLSIRMPNLLLLRCQVIMRTRHSLYSESAIRIWFQHGMFILPDWVYSPWRLNDQHSSLFTRDIDPGNDAVSLYAGYKESAFRPQPGKGCIH